MIVKKEYPIKYFCLGAGGTPEKSDLDLIIKLMSVIPSEEKDNISNKYESLYGNGKEGGRGLANTFLNEVARKYAKAPCDPMTINGFYGQLMNITKDERVERFTKSGTKLANKYTGPSILEMAAQIK